MDAVRMRCSKVHRAACIHLMSLPSPAAACSTARRKMESTLMQIPSSLKAKPQKHITFGNILQIFSACDRAHEAGSAAGWEYVFSLKHLSVLVRAKLVCSRAHPLKHSQQAGCVKRFCGVWDKDQNDANFLKKLSSILSIISVLPVRISPEVSNSHTTPEK